MNTITNKHNSGITNIICLILLGIIEFIAVYFPLRGGNLQFEFGVFFRQLFSTIGTLILFFGVGFILFGIIAFFSHRPLSGFGFLLLGMFLLALSGYFLGPAGGGGASGGGSEVPQGYH